MPFFQSFQSFGLDGPRTHSVGIMATTARPGYKATCLLATCLWNQAWLHDCPGWATRPSNHWCVESALYWWGTFTEPSPALQVNALLFIIVQIYSPSHCGFAWLFNINVWSYEIIVIHNKKCYYTNMGQIIV